MNEKAEDERSSTVVMDGGLGIIGLSALSVLYVLVSSGVRAARRKTPAQV